ncbi:hypothetical protein QFC21_003131 [Naganishia friedmannii]|uniref:Uncharacterized protein n=1 Tax=Naganishia friedmannii TaxID=89922 RepID=A0ACC2VTM6_9TREE|nr:hypothetical protein QFC21_003131 [Naganishia friedmannii]
MSPHNQQQQQEQYYAPPLHGYPHAQQVPQDFGASTSETMEGRKRKTYTGQEGLGTNHPSMAESSYPSEPPGGGGYSYIQASYPPPPYPQPQTGITSSSSPTLPFPPNTADSFNANPGGSGSPSGAPTFVACTKCRHRKIKCGGQRPICENCEKKGLECVFDVVVKRRGPDKQPGGRMKKRGSGHAVSGSGGGEGFATGGEPGYLPTNAIKPETIFVKTEYQSTNPGTMSPLQEIHGSIIDVKPVLLPPPGESRPDWETGRRQQPPVESSSVGHYPSHQGTAAAAAGHMLSHSPETATAFSSSMPPRTLPFTTTAYQSVPALQQAIHHHQPPTQQYHHLPPQYSHSGPTHDGPLMSAHHIPRQGYSVNQEYPGPSMMVPEHARGMVGSHQHHQQQISSLPPPPPPQQHHALPYGGHPPEHVAHHDVGYAYHPSAPQLPPQPHQHMYTHSMAYPLPTPYQHHPPPHHAPMIGGNGVPSRTPSIPQEYRTGENTPSVLEISRPTSSSNVQPYGYGQTMHLEYAPRGPRQPDGGEITGDEREVWSPSVMGKLGMADLVTGYDPVQHIAAGANMGLGLTVRSNSSNFNSENGDVSEEEKQNGSFQLIQHHGYTNGHSQMVRGEEAFTRGLVLERLPNTEYARESDWVWMTGLFSTNRVEGIRMLDTELRFFFDMNMQWFQYFNRSLFFATLYHEVDRYEIQPALILSMLAITTLVKSAHQGPSAVGKQNAVTFADAARAMIQQSIVANKVDPTLAQAALVLMAFEFYPYPQHSFDRTVSAIHLFDSIAHMFQLLACDVSDERVSIFIPNAVPVLTLEAGGSPQTGNPAATREEIVRSSHEAEEQEEIKELIKWSPKPQWPVHWSVAQVRQDEARRMCWTASSMVANFSLWTHTLGLQPLDLYMSNPANYALFFPAEPLLVNKDPVVGKQTMWALYNRVVLLWHFTLKAQQMPLPLEGRDSLYLEIWRETHRIEEALFHIGMNAGQTQKWQARDWIINILSLLTDNFTRFTPGMLDGKTGQLASLEGYRSWVKQQAELGSLLKAMSPAASKLNAAGEEQPPAPAAILGRPFFAWPLLHMVQNALATFEMDHSRFETIKIAAGVLRVVKIISDAWPNPVLHANLFRLQSHFNSIIARGDLPPDWATRPILTPEEQAALAELQVVVSSSPP